MPSFILECDLSHKDLVLQYFQKWSHAMIQQHLDSAYQFTTEFSEENYLVHALSKF